jgi:uncharacterized membrane protein YkoI
MRMTRRMTIAVGAALALAAGGAGAAIAVGGGTDEADERTTGPAADRAAEAALALYPGGTVGGVEAESEERARWEVEIRTADGTIVDVKLDADLRRVSAETDEPEGQGDED